MNPRLARVVAVPLTILVVGAVLAFAAPAAMSQYRAYDIRFGPNSGCPRVGTSLFSPTAPTPPPCPSVAEANRRPFVELMIDGAARSLVLLAGAALLAATVGGLLGVAVALLRRRAIASGGVVGLMSLLAAIPSFFAAYFLQITVIVLGAREGGHLLPVYGFGYDDHIVLPLLAISIPAIAFTAQMVSTRMQDVLDADFVTTATAKGLLQSRIIWVHVLPHVRPVLLESLGSGLRVSVASLPIIEYLFHWNGIGQLSLQAVALKDPAAFVACGVVLVSVFAILSAVADLSRPHALYRA